VAEEPKHVFWRHRFDRQSGTFRFFCPVCYAREASDASPAPRLTQISEDLLREYLHETGGEVITCSGCGDILVRREGL
jgi:hypothetical protein